MNLTKLLALCFIFSFAVEINAQEITMFPGFFGVKYYQDDRKISTKEAKTLIKADQEAYKLWKKADQYNMISGLSSVALIGFVGWSLYRAENGGSQLIPVIGYTATLGMSLGFGISANNSKRDAILKYNKNVDTATLNLGTTANGAGLVLSF